MSLRVRLALFASGACAGGLGATAYYQSKLSVASRKVIDGPPASAVIPVAPPLPNAGTRLKEREPPKSNVPAAPSGGSAELARQVMKFGFPGPVNDVRYRDAYIVSYNRQHRNANWVAERITKENLIRGESVDRTRSKFVEDSTIPEKFRVSLKDYLRSGYDRGHLAPAADAKYNQDAMDETFMMTNMSPQVGRGFNRDYWAYLENFCRGLAQQFPEVYVFSGPLYLPKIETATKRHVVSYEAIGSGINAGSVAVPTHFYKVIMVVDGAGRAEGLGGFVLPNAPILDDHPLEAFVTPIDAIERASGVEFFEKVDRTKVPALCGRVKCVVTPPTKAQRKQIEQAAEERGLSTK